MTDWRVNYTNGSELIYREGSRRLDVGAERGSGDAVVLYMRDLTHWTEPAGEPLTGEQRDEFVRRVREDLAGDFEVYIDM